MIIAHAIDVRDSVIEIFSTLFLDNHHRDRRLLLLQSSPLGGSKWLSTEAWPFARRGYRATWRFHRHHSFGNAEIVTCPEGYPSTGLAQPQNSPIYLTSALAPLQEPLSYRKPHCFPPHTQSKRSCVPVSRDTAWLNLALSRYPNLAIPRWRLFLSGTTPRTRPLGSPNRVLKRAATVLRSVQGAYSTDCSRVYNIMLLRFDVVTECFRDPQANLAHERAVLSHDCFWAQAPKPLRTINELNWHKPPLGAPALLHSRVHFHVGIMSAVSKAWHNYSYLERRNIAIYIGGIMCYKLGLEFFNGSITTLATDRFKVANTFTKLGAAQGLNQAAQCVGAILIAPLVKKWPTRTVLSVGGEFKDLETNKVRYGTWTPNLIFLIWTVSGICYVDVECVAQPIYSPADIVGGNANKLRRMDALVHMLYEVAGTSGAFASSSAISRWGNNYSFFLTPVFFTFAGAIWMFISVLNHDSADEELEQAGLANVERSKKPASNYFVMVFRGILNFGESIWVGARLIFGNRCFIWLLPAYSIALYLHRFLESSLAPAFAKRVLGISAWSQIMVGGSNFGEFLGAAAVLALSSRVPTPLPWLRFDALALNLVWILPSFSRKATHDVSWAWKIAGCFIPISMGWAAGDVSLAAYIQSTLPSRSTNTLIVPATPAAPVQPLRRLWKDVYSERLTIERNWRRGRCTVRILKGHTDGVMCLQFNETLSHPAFPVLITGSMTAPALQFDEVKLITGSMDNTLKVWDWRRGKCIRTLTGHTEGVVCLNFDSNVLASGSVDSTIKVWNLRTGGAFTLRGHTDWVNAVQLWDSNGRQPSSDASSLFDGSRSPPSAYGSSSSAQCGPCIDPGKMLFSASDDGTIKLWDLTLRTCVKVFTGHVGQVQSMRLLVASECDGDAEDDASEFSHPASIEASLSASNDTTTPRSKAQETPPHLGLAR
ncbi:hypothetical protein NMY22_g1271 [Coprinellus aureogranulatus]|nr:hypothetical protein NMY22_g1271 [Coprinellus aureogranulatus]